MSDQILLKTGDEFEKYTVEKELGHGGMGAVYLVCHKVLGAKFALKVLYPEVAKRDRQFVERFIREARLAGGIRHQNLIAVYDAGLNEPSGMYYLVMDYVAGGSVRELLKNDGYVDMVEAISIVRQVASALEAAQQRNMVHRDIKPDNIMFDSHGIVRLADLGIAKATDDSEGNLTMEASVFGTPSYMSPEQARDASKVDTRADIYSLGVVLFEMLTGRRPFGGENSIEILSHVIGPEEAPDVRTYSPDIPEAVAELVADMLAKDITKRVASPTALIKRINCLDLSEYGAAEFPHAEKNAAAEELDVTLQTLPSMPAAKAPAEAPVAESADKAPAAEEELDVTLQTLPSMPAAKAPAAAPVAESADKAPAAEEELDVTLQTLPQAPAANSSAPSSAPAATAEEQRTLPDLGHQKAAISSVQTHSLRPFRLVLFGSLAALLLVVLLAGFFLIGKLKNKNVPPSGQENVKTPLVASHNDTQPKAPLQIADTGKDDTQTTVSIADDVKDHSMPTDSATDANVMNDSLPVGDNVAPVIIPPAAVTPPEVKKDLKSVGEVVDGGVVLFGADSAAILSLHNYLEANGEFAGVAYREANSDVKLWCEQLAEIQGGNPAFVVVVISKEKNTPQFRKTLEDVIKMLPASNAALFVNTGDAGIFDEITRACMPVGMYVRKWASNKELTAYLQELRQELGW